MALIKCNNCGQLVSDKASRCPKCGAPVVKQPVAPVEAPPSTNTQPARLTPRPANPPAQPAQPAPRVDNSYAEMPQQSSSQTKIIIIVVSVVLLLICGGVGGYFYYKNVYLPKKIEREAPRYYTFGNLMLRSSQLAGVDYNKIAMLPYGTRLITYAYGDEWSKVKVESADPNAIPLEGYVASPYLLDPHDFMLLNSIFADVDSRDAIPASKAKLALLSYYKKHKYIGRLSAEQMEEAGIDISKTNDNQWQVSVRAAENKPNEVYYKKVLYSDSKYNDFAVIIKNIITGERKLLYFYFDDDETPYFYTEQYAPETGYIKSISKDYDGDLFVNYTYDDSNYCPY